MSKKMRQDVDTIYVAESKDGILQGFGFIIGLGVITFKNPQDAIAWISETPGAKDCKPVAFIRER